MGRSRRWLSSRLAKARSDLRQRLRSFSNMALLSGVDVSPSSSEVTQAGEALVARSLDAARAERGDARRRREESFCEPRTSDNP